jgi:hypothetical protein
MAQTGMIQGLEHPIEWYMAYCRTLATTLSSEDAAREAAIAEETFIAFLQETASGPSDPIAKLDVAGLGDLIVAFYDKGRLLRETVEHYANPANYRDGRVYHVETRCKRDPIECDIIDNGKLARDALEKLGLRIPGQNPRKG